MAINQMLFGTALILAVTSHAIAHEGYEEERNVGNNVPTTTSQERLQASVKEEKPEEYEDLKQWCDTHNHGPYYHYHCYYGYHYH